jgi:Domain of unknown function (DUF4333)
MHPQTPPPRIARAVRIRRGSAVAVISIACAAVISACGLSNSSTASSSPAKTTLNTAQVALSIKQSILTQRHLKAKVVCPAAVPQEKGKTFECIATTRGVKPPFPLIKTPFVVTVQNDKGFVTYAGK